MNDYERMEIECEEILQECLRELEAGIIECPDYVAAKKAYDLGHTRVPIHLGMKRYL